MSERKEPDIDLSELNLDEEPSQEPNSPVSEPEAPVEPPRNPVNPDTTSAEGKGHGGTWLLSFILLLMVAGCGAIAYWVDQLQKQTAADQQVMAELHQQLEDARNQLAEVTDSTSESGNTLMQRLQAMSGKLNTRQDKLDKELGELRALAEGRNKAQLQTLADKVAALQKSAQQLKGQVATLAAANAKLEKQLSSADKQNQQYAKDIQSVRNGLGALEKKLDKVSSANDLAISLLQDQEDKKIASLRSEIAQLKKTGGQNSRVNARLNDIEQSIKAIDGSRRQVSRDLLQIRQQIGALQSKVH